MGDDKAEVLDEWAAERQAGAQQVYQDGRLGNCGRGWK